MMSYVTGRGGYARRPGRIRVMITVLTYDAVRDVRHDEWQESRWAEPPGPGRYDSESESSLAWRVAGCGTRRRRLRPTRRIDARSDCLRFHATVSVPTQAILSALRVRWRVNFNLNAAARARSPKDRIPSHLRCRRTQPCRNPTIPDWSGATRQAARRNRPFFSIWPDRRAPL